MAKRITINLSDKAEKYLNNVMSSLDLGSGQPVSMGMAVSHALEELSDYEDLTQNHITGYLFDTFPDEMMKRKETYLHPLLTTKTTNNG